MEFLAQFAFEIICGIILLIVSFIVELTVESPRVKTWMKSVMCFVLSQSMTAFIAWLAVMVYDTGNTVDSNVVGALAVLWGVGMLSAVIYGHITKWKRNEFQ